MGSEACFEGRAPRTWSWSEHGGGMGIRGPFDVMGMGKAFTAMGKPE